jgi:divalent metal cation (Fe/Co/Zn/Cd) transporter
MGDIKVDMHLLVQSGMSLEDVHIILSQSQQNVERRTQGYF